MDQNSNTPRQHHYFIWLGLLLTLVLIVWAAGLYWWSGHQFKRGSAYGSLIEENAEFVAGEELRKLGARENNVRMLEHYKKALLVAKNTEEEAAIKFAIAHATLELPDASGENANALEAIRLLKEIAGNDQYSSRWRAQAVQELDLVPHTEAVYQEIFKDPPFNAMVDAASMNESYRALLEYGADFYPLATIESRLGIGLAVKLMSRVAAGSISEAEKTQKINEIVQKLDLANREIERMRAFPIEEEQIPNVLVYQATLVGKLAHLGAKTHEEAKQAFTLAIDEHAKRGWTNIYLNFNYAIYLGWEGSAKDAEIQEILTPVYDTSLLGANRFYKMLGNARRDPTLRSTKYNAALLAKKDPRFNDLLVSLGWTKVDVQAAQTTGVLNKN